MINERVEWCIGAEVQEAELAVSSHKNTWGFARVAGPGACIIETGNT